MAQASSTLVIETKPPNQDPFARLVERLKSSCDFESDSRIWIAYSGGADSTVLLHAARAAFEPSRLGAIHVNHGLSSLACEWECHCERTAASLGIEFKSRSVKLQGNIEAAGRRARLKLFGQLLNDVDVILTGHHRDDEVESLLWQLATGRAMVGISERLALTRGYLVRPMLDLYRSEILAIAAAHKLSWVEDESNRDLSFSRNALRHQIIPKLRCESENFDSLLFRMKEPDLAVIAREPLELSKSSIKPLEIRAWLHAYGVTATDPAIREIARQGSAKEDANIVVKVSHDASVRRYGKELHLVRERKQGMKSTVIVGENAETLFDFGVLRWTEDHAGLPTDLELEVRQREGGETLTIDGKNYRLSEWFREHRIPPWEREAWPLLFHAGELVAVPGMGVAAHLSDAGRWFPDWRRTDQTY